MFPSRVGASSRVRRNKRTNTQAVKIGTEEMPTIMDVDEIKMPDYNPITTQVVEEENPTHEVGHLEEDVERIESDVSREKGTQQEEQAMGSVQQGLNPKEEHEIEHKDVPEVRASSPQEKKKKQIERSAQGIKRAHVELEIVMTQILEGVKVDDEIVGVNTMKYSDHDVVDAIKFLDFV
jgi:hypothetical protein